MNCNTCGTAVHGDSVFCDSCGAIVDSAPAPHAHAEPAGPAFEETQMIEVADELPAPPMPPMQPAASQPAPQQVPVRPRQSAAPVYATQPKRSMIPLVGGALVLLGLVVLAFVIRGALSSDSDDVAGEDGATEEVGDPVVTEEPADTADADDDPAEPDSSSAVVVPDGFVLYEGACFAAAVPESWVLTEDSGLRSYGRRTAWSRGNEELFVDTSPILDATVTGRDAADEQLNLRSTATSGLIEEPGRADMWSYTYTRSGTPSIAIYFVEERGFGVVGSSSQNPDSVMAEARQVSASIQVTQSDC